MVQTKSLGILDRSVLLLLLALAVLIVMLLSFSLAPVFVWFAFNALVLFGVLFYLVVFLANPNIGGRRAPKSFPSVSIVVPAFNSRNTIEKCVASLKNLRYPKKIEIIVVDDCSTDGTHDILKKIKGITLVRLKQNSGISVAVNKGIEKSSSELVVCIDSDSYPERDLFYKTLGYFDDAKVAAVSCLILPDKSKTVIQKLQYFEYLAGFGLNNSVLSSVNSSYVAPGPMTIFRRSVFEKIGFFEPNILAQDMDFGLRIKKAGLKIMTCVEAVVLTDIPSGWGDLFKQRNRWYRGGTFSFMKHKSLLFNRLNPDFGFYVMPFMFFTQILTVAVILRLLLYFVLDVLKFFSVVVGYFSLGGAIPTNFPPVVVPPAIAFFLITYVVVALYFTVSFVFAKRYPKFSELPVLLMLIFIYPYFVTFTYSQSYFREIFGTGSKWVRVST